MIAKEVRALLPAWTACALAVWASGSGIAPLSYLGLPLYLIAVSALGALSIGHEYAYETMGFALALPVSRQRIWAAKLGVLLPMLAALALLAAWRVELDRADRVYGIALVWLPALAALFIAPWLTMLMRSPLGGTVFTVGLVGWAMAWSEWATASSWYGFTLVGGLSLVGALAGWRTFSRLEVSGERGAHLQIRFASPAAASAARVRRRHPLVALVWKELRLQQIPIVVAVIYGIGSAAVALWTRVDHRVFDVLSILATLYMIVMPAVIGSLAAAEERQFGTHDAQLLLPVTASSQWTVKAGTAIVLSLALAVLLPAAVKSQLPAWALREFGPRGLIDAQVIITVLGCASVALYVSTLARSAISALLFSLGAIAGVVSFLLNVTRALSVRVHLLVYSPSATHTPHLLPSNGALWIVPLVLFTVLLWRLALTNYRYGNGGAPRIVWHAAGVAGFLALYGAVAGVVMAFIE